MASNENETRKLLFGMVVQDFINRKLTGIELNRVQASVRPADPSSFVRRNYPGVKYIAKEGRHYLVNTVQYKSEVEATKKTVSTLVGKYIVTVEEVKE